MTHLAAIPSGTPEILQSYSVAYFYAKINNLKQHLHRMVLLQNNVTSRLSYLYLVETKLKLL
jgi:hypothetical protein